MAGPAAARKPTAVRGCVAAESFAVKQYPAGTTGHKNKQQGERDEK